MLDYTLYQTFKPKLRVYAYSFILQSKTCGIQIVVLVAGYRNLRPKVEGMSSFSTRGSILRSLRAAVVMLHHLHPHLRRALDLNSKESWASSLNTKSKMILRLLMERVIEPATKQCSSMDFAALSTTFI